MESFGYEARRRTRDCCLIKRGMIVIARDRYFGTPILVGGCRWFDFLNKIPFHFTSLGRIIRRIFVFVFYISDSRFDLS